MLTPARQYPYKSKDLLMPDFERQGYAYAIGQWLESVDDFYTFIDSISQILDRLGFSGWAYCRIDIPLSFSQTIGSFSEPYQKYDLMYQHLLTSSSCIYRSEVATVVRSFPAATRVLRKNLKIIEKFEQQGIYEAVGIPISTEGYSNHAAFTLVAEGVASDKVVSTFSANREKLDSIIHAVDEIGSRRYPEQFIAPKKHFDYLKNGRPLKLLEAMINNDLGIEKAADALGMSRTAADKQLAKLRNYLGTRTTHGALHKAIKLGLITISGAAK